MTYFIFCIHNHQPAGNFDYVLEHAYSKAYEPMLKRLHEKPFFKFSFHISGFLLESGGLDAMAVEGFVEVRAVAACKFGRLADVAVNDL